MSANDKFLSQRQRYQPVTLPQDFSDEEMARDWTLSEIDKQEVGKYRKNPRLFIAIQLCAVRLYGRFLGEVNDLSPQIVNYLSSQLELPPSLTITVPDRDATFSEQRKNILGYLGFSKYDDGVQANLQEWLKKTGSARFFARWIIFASRALFIVRTSNLAWPRCVAAINDTPFCHLQLIACLMLLWPQLLRWPAKTDTHTKQKRLPKEPILLNV